MTDAPEPQQQPQPPEDTLRKMQALAADGGPQDVVNPFRTAAFSGDVRSDVETGVLEIDGNETLTPAQYRARWREFFGLELPMVTEE